MLDRIMRAIGREPLRLWAYGVAVPALAILARHRLLAADDVALWVALLAAIVAPTELARQQVTPVADPRLPPAGSPEP